MEHLDFNRALAEARERLQKRTTEPDSEGREASYAVRLNCPKCHGARWVYPAVPARLSNGQFNPDYFKAVPCECLKQTFEERRRLALMKYCNLPDATDPKTFENYRIQTDIGDYCAKAYRAAIDLVGGEAKFLLLSGPVNFGKSHLAMAVCHEFIEAGTPAKFFPCGFFLRELKATFDRDATTKYHDVFNRACTVPLLVLDDLFEDKMTDWAVAELEALINARYLGKLATIFTTNKTMAEMNEISDRITSRLQRESWCRVVVFE